MRLCMISPRLTCWSDGLNLLSFTSQRDPSWGQSVRRMFLLFISCQEWHSRISAYYCLFLQGLSQHLGFFISLASQLCLIWTLTPGLRYVLEGPINFCMSPKFLEGLLVLDGPLNFWCHRRFWRGYRHGPGLFGGFSLTGNFRASCWDFPSTRSDWRYLLLSPGWYFPPLSYGGFLQALSFPKRFPIFSGLRNPLRDCSAPARDVLGSLLPAFLSRRSVTKNYLGISSLLSDRPTLVAAFSLHYVEEGRIKQR